MTRTTEYKSPLGRMLLAVDEEGLTGAWFEGQKYLPEGVAPENEETALPPVLESACRWLDLYFSGQEPDFMPRLHLEGTAFRRAVWELLRKIPYGKTTTYGALAKQLEAETGRRVSAQAVGGAVGHNPVSILVSCHRVVGQQGSLTGYAGGLDKKLRLLILENTSAEPLYQKMYLNVSSFWAILNGVDYAELGTFAVILAVALCGMEL